MLLSGNRGLAKEVKVITEMLTDGKSYFKG
jgi:hypothetical protein